MPGLSRQLVIVALLAAAPVAQEAAPTLPKSPGAETGTETGTETAAEAAAEAAGRDPSAGEPRAAALFDFRSGFWVDLHQRLHHAATLRRPLPPGAPADPEAPAWTAAVDFYRERFAAQGGMTLLFDPALVALNRTLSELGSGPALTGVEPELAGHLQAAGELVRDAWAAEEAAHRAWIEALQPALAREGPAIAAELAAALQVPWPEAPVRVDVARWAGPVGAYTVLDPPHVTIASAEPSNAGDAALEVLFHEAAHALIGKVQGALAEQAESRGRQAPRDLWHAVLFFTTGQVVARHLGPDYVPYATKNGLWTRAWPGVEEALRTAWQPYLDGRAELGPALGALLDELPER